MSKLLANWSVPENIHAFTSLRTPGHSKAPFDCNNLGLHVGDNKEDVLQNRNDLRNSMNLPTEPAWLEQTHSTLCVLVDNDDNRKADAAITRTSGQVLAIMTADCLPIMLCNQQGTEVAAIHAGWRGLMNGIIENTIAKMSSPAKSLCAWIGPSICQDCYEVGGEVLEAFSQNHDFAHQAFKSHKGKWLANLPQLAQLILNKSQVLSVYQSKICTFERKKDLFSYRRNAQTGRMATLIWFT